MVQEKFFFIILVIVVLISGESDAKVFKLCSVHSLEFFDFCQKILDQYKMDDNQLECVEARDRMECLDMILNNKADLVGLEAEDVYIAEQLNNNKFRTIAELRQNGNDEYYDEDQILIKKSSTIKSLKDLKGSKSCHSGFKGIYGYKIPIVVLKRHGLLQISNDSTIPPVEKDLKALSEFFKQSCIVAPLNDKSFHQKWKKKYANICELCENPIDCDINDKYSRTSGAIECLVNGKGDVAFTSRSSVQKYFGLTNKEGNKDFDVNNYELLCEDGSRKPINGTGCSLAKRPHPVFITTNNITDNENLSNNLLSQLKLAYNRKNLISHVTSLKDYLVGFKDYIERDGNYKMKLCVATNIELQKCEILMKVALTRRLPDIECYLSEKNDCPADVASDKAHIAIVPGYNWTMVENTFSNLIPVAYENLDLNRMYIAEFDSVNSLNDVLKFPIKFNNTDKRAFKAACLLHLVLGNNDCENLDGKVKGENYIEIVRIDQRHNYGRNKDLLCLNKIRSYIGDYRSCNLNRYYQNAVYVNGNKNFKEVDKHNYAITLLGAIFGHNGYGLRHIFDLFSPFKGHNNVIFNDIAGNLNGGKIFDDFPEEYYDFFVQTKLYE